MMDRAGGYHFGSSASMFSGRVEHPVSMSALRPGANTLGDWIVTNDDNRNIHGRPVWTRE